VARGQATRRTSKRSPAARPIPARNAGPPDERLLSRLRKLRYELAREAKIPSYCVFSDATLTAFAALRPASEAELLEVKGVGSAKLEKYGGAFLRAIAEETAHR
jgi:superfamily II DNA helicase RecQ